MSRLERKVAIITGSSSGIGRAIATLYAKQGALVVCSDLSPTARSEIPGETQIDTDALIQKEGGEAIFVKADAGREKDMENLMEEAVKRFGRVDMSVLKSAKIVNFREREEGFNGSQS
ncbi:MAG: hypothetical protein Q9165_007680 [Trypethelium subeluteriae]